MYVYSVPPTRRGTVERHERGTQCLDYTGGRICMSIIDALLHPGITWDPIVTMTTSSRNWLQLVLTPMSQLYADVPPMVD